MNRQLFQSKANRDAAWRAGGKRGFRSSVRNQQLHPMYVADYPRPSAEDCGIGNTIYKTLFGVLYILES